MVSRSRLDFTKRITTRAGSSVEIYYIREGVYINGAYFDEGNEVWWPVQWDWEGNYAAKKSALDLINVRSAEKIKA